MALTRPSRVLSSGFAAIGMLSLLAGCGRAEVGTPDSRTASASGRKIVAATTVESRAHRVAPPSFVPPPAEAATSQALEPVAAPKPAAAEPSGVALASAEQAAPVAAVTTDPAEDPSKYPGGIIPASPNAQPLPGGPRLLVPERTFRPEGRPQALRVNYDDLDLLRVLNMGDPLPADVVEQFPSWLRELDGKTIRLRGFMYPAYEEELSRFILTRDTGACCFGPNPKIYYLVGVKMKDETKARYVENRPIDVTGTFHIDPRYVDGNWFQLYRITDASVEN